MLLICCIVCADAITYIILSAWEFHRLMLQSEAECQEKKVVYNAESNSWGRKVLKFSLCSLPFSSAAPPPPLHFSWNCLREISFWRWRYLKVLPPLANVICKKQVWFTMTAVQFLSWLSNCSSQMRQRKMAIGDVSRRGKNTSSWTSQGLLFWSVTCVCWTAVLGREPPGTFGGICL